MNPSPAHDPIPEKPPDSPLRPDLVLRLGFAGQRQLPPNTDSLVSALHEVLKVIGNRLVEIAPGPSGKAAHERTVSRYYSENLPRMRLVAGLAEGADTLAAQAALDDVANGPLKGKLDIELAAVLPFPFAEYRDSRPSDFQPIMDAWAARCAYILTLDGIYDKPTPDTQFASTRRARAHRAQSTILLRQVDLLIAVADPRKPIKAGGTLETVRLALGFGVAVIFIPPATGEIHLIQPGRIWDMTSLLAAPPKSPNDWQEVLRGWITNLVANPDVEIGVAPGAATVHRGHTLSPEEQALLNEYFSGGPPKADLAGIVRKELWSRFSAKFRSPDRTADLGDPELAQVAKFRKRATDLSRHYAGLYRGAFLLNYSLAVVAVFLAALSLVVLGMLPTDESAGEVWRVVLLFLGVLKLGCVIGIFSNTHEANHGHWNDKAVDFRYLAERLRAMHYLPRIGSFQPPSARPPQHSPRIIRQSAIDWLFQAMVRAVSPTGLPSAQRVSPAQNAGSTNAPATLIAIDSAAAARDVHERWVLGQATYHKNNEGVMSRMENFMKTAGEFLSISVILIVLFDVILLVSEVFGLLPECWSAQVGRVAPWLVFVATVLPAAVASLNGVRFQSECGRLAERSAFMHALLQGRDGDWKGSQWEKCDALVGRIERAHADGDENHGAWTLELLELTETVAQDFVQEVAEWAVLYAKQLPEA